jgi:hypothetical protein
VAHREYVKEEEDPRLAKFGRLLIAAPRMLEFQGVKDQLVEKKRSTEKMGVDGVKPRSGLSRAERENFYAAQRWLGMYNDLLNDVVDAAGEEHLPPDKLTKWLSEASGDPEWAHSLVVGMQTERAALKLAEGVPGIENPHRTDLGDDMQGKDIVFDPTERGFSYVDAKLRDHRGAMPVEVIDDVDAGGKMLRSVRLNIAPHHMDMKKYEVKPGVSGIYRRCMELVLVDGEELNPKTLDVIYKEVEAERDAERERLGDGVKAA